MRRHKEVRRKQSSEHTQVETTYIELKEFRLIVQEDDIARDWFEGQSVSGVFRCGNAVAPFQS